MKFRNVWLKYYSPESGGEGAGGGNAEGAGEGAGGTTGEGAGAGATAEGTSGATDGKKSGMSDSEHALLRENMQRKEQLKKTNDDLFAAKEALKRFEGIDPDAVRKLLADQRAAETSALEAKGEYERVKAMMTEEHGREKSALQAQIDALQTQLSQKDGTINELSIGSQFAQSKFIGEELTLTPSKARVIYGEHFDVVDGKVVPFDKPRSASNRTPLVNAQGEHLDFESALKRIVEADPDKDHLLRSKVKPGAGSGSQKPAGVPGSAKPTDGVSMIAAGLKAAGINPHNR
jgi:hypothetical protein